MTDDITSSNPLWRSPTLLKNVHGRIHPSLKDVVTRTWSSGNSAHPNRKKLCRMETPKVGIHALISNRVLLLFFVACTIQLGWHYVSRVLNFVLRLINKYTTRSRTGQRILGGRDRINVVVLNVGEACNLLWCWRRQYLGLKLWTNKIAPCAQRALPLPLLSPGIILEPSPMKMSRSPQTDTTTVNLLSV